MRGVSFTIYNNDRYILGRHLTEDGYPCISTNVKDIYQLIDIIKECFENLGEEQTIMCEGVLNETYLKVVHSFFPKAKRVFIEDAGGFMIEF